MKFFLTFSLLLFTSLFLGCDKLSSRFDMPQETPPVPQEKAARCSVDFKKTCWSETVREITSCMVKSQSQDKFHGDQQFCSNDANKFVHFKNADQLFTSPYSPLLSPFTFSFSANKDSAQDCFSVEGSGNDLKITVPGYKPLYVIRDDQGLVFNCLDGQQISVNKEVVDGCQKKNGLSSIPGVNFGPFAENNQQSGWRFSFRGASVAKEIFRCYY